MLERFALTSAPNRQQRAILLAQALRLVGDVFAEPGAEDVGQEIGFDLAALVLDLAGLAGGVEGFIAIVAAYPTIGCSAGARVVEQGEGAGGFVAATLRAP